MIEIETLNLGIYWANCYLVRDSGSDGCVMIDLGGDPERVLERLRELNLKLEAILLTHGHFDHVGGVKAVREATGCPVYLHPADMTLPQSFTAGPLEPTDFLEEGQVLSLAGLTFRVLHTPGHTPGSVCFRTDEALFTGDTLFSASCGRTDLPGGDQEKMPRSLARLHGLDYHGPVYPGHDRATDLDLERQYNPFLREAVKP